jgi:ATP-binding cassette subfamily B protein
LISFLTVLVSFNPLLATIVMMAVLPQLILDLHMGRQRFQISYSNSPKQRFAFYYRQLLSRIDAVKELRLFNLGEHFLGKLLRTISDIHNSQRRQEQRQIKWQLIINLIHSLVGKVGFVIVVAQAFLGNISIGDVVLYTSAVASVQIALIGLFSTFSQLSESLLFFKQYTRLISLPPDLPIPTVPHPISPLKLGIEFRDVSFRYDEQYPWVLHHFNLTIPAGKCLALVGMNGAGKTTLVKLLTRFYDPTEGQILWDGIDIREFDPKALRQQVSAIFQDFTKYDLSAQENIGVGNIQHLENLARIKEAAQKADISNIIEDLPQGYQTPLSRWLTENEIGSDLSIGQWQKVAIARMWMRDASLLILDEPTSALDVKTEFAIYSQFVDLIEGQTCLLISHRFSTMNIANIIAVIENGRIVEYGTHRELLANGDSYAKLYGYYSKLHKEDPIGQNGTPVADDYNTVMNPTKH